MKQSSSIIIDETNNFARDAESGLEMLFGIIIASSTWFTLLHILCFFKQTFNNWIQELEMQCLPNLTQIHVLM